MSVPFAIENPYRSLLWQTKELLHLLRLPGVCSKTADFCQHGEKYQKRTQFLSYGSPHVDAIAKTCEGKGGLCSRTGKEHELLSGAIECPPDMLHLVPGYQSGGVKPRPMARPAKRPPMIWRTKLAEP